MKGNVKVYRKRGKVNASEIIKFRVTKDEKEKLFKLAEAKNLTVSELIRANVILKKSKEVLKLAEESTKDYKVSDN